MTHEERLRLIYKPFFITRMPTSYPWSGRNTGGYLFADISGGRWVSAVNEIGDMQSSGGGRGFSVEGGFSLLELQRRITDEPDSPITKFTTQEEA